MKKITIKWLQKKEACIAGQKWFLQQSESEAPAVIEALIAEKKLDWANWLVVRFLKRKQQIQYAVYAAELVLSIWESKYPNDNRPRKAIEAAKACIIRNSKSNRTAAAYAATAAYAAYAATAAYAAADAATAAYAAAAAADAADAADAAAYAAAAYAAAYAAYAAAAYAATADADATAYAAAALTKIIRYGINLLEEK